MDLPTPPAVYYQIQEFEFAHQVSGRAFGKLTQDKEVFLGQSKLIEINGDSQSLELSEKFKSLLSVLVSIGEVDPKVKQAKNIYELNTLLQQEHGGLLRKPGTERWDTTGSQALKSHQSQIDMLLIELGFGIPKQVHLKKSCNHCIIFGARMERVAFRIQETMANVSSTIDILENMYILGSNRVLEKDEIIYLKKFTPLFSKESQQAWNKILNDTPTEANGCILLWEALVSEQERNTFKDRVICINTTKNGYSYHENSGHRPTTESTIVDWMSMCNFNQPLTIFALSEQPYLRLCDQLKYKVYKSIYNTLPSNGQISPSFVFAHPLPPNRTPIHITLDEIARNVYQISKAIEFLDSTVKYTPDIFILEA
jgi:hypothetical protein